LKYSPAAASASSTPIASAPRRHAGRSVVASTSARKNGMLQVNCMGFALTSKTIPAGSRSRHTVAPSGSAEKTSLRSP
jgi:hypothetical protein